MKCSMCGREITNPEANYCDYCGTQVGETVYHVEPAQPQQTGEVKRDRVPTLWYLGVMCLPLVPMVGSIAYLVMLFYWAFAPSIEDSRKSWARAALIYTGITLALGIVLFGAIFSLVMSTMSNVL
ncbi:MAG: zinc ribbon domain-containing protein [Anaerotignum sp.]|nr:zinc ribbon domain-containing protein [Anaerotignum sp.]